MHSGDASFSPAPPRTTYSQHILNELSTYNQHLLFKLWLKKHSLRTLFCVKNSSRIVLSTQNKMFRKPTSNTQITVWALGRMVFYWKHWHLWGLYVLSLCARGFLDHTRLQLYHTLQAFTMDWSWLDHFWFRPKLFHKNDRSSQRRNIQYLPIKLPKSSPHMWVTLTGKDSSLNLIQFSTRFDNSSIKFCKQISVPKYLRSFLSRCGKVE